MNPPRVTMLENSDFRFRFFQTSPTEKRPSAPDFTCNRTQPALKLADTNTRSPSSTTVCAHVGHLSMAHLYTQRMGPSLGSWPVTLGALTERICRVTARVTRVGELKLALSWPARHADEPSSRRKASKVEPLVMPPVTTTR